MTVLNKRICPLAMSGMFGPPREGQSVFTCLLDGCGFWDDSFQRCGVASIATHLQDLNDTLTQQLRQINEMMDSIRLGLRR